MGNYSPLSYWGRQIIAREVEQEIMRRAVPKAAAKGSSAATATTTKQNNGTSAVPNHLQTLRPKTINSKTTSKFKETVSTQLRLSFYRIYY